MYLTQNREMKQDGVWNFTLPAWVVELPDGSHFNVCPNAGACAKFCYARNGTYLFPKVRGKHLRNLELVRDNPRWIDELCSEIEHKRFRPTGVPRVVPGLESTDHLTPWVRQWLQSGGQAIRIHDSGDFFSAEYLRGWITIAERNPDILFYFYTKELTLLRQEREYIPANMLWIYSMGGKQDDLLDPEVERHADVFPSLEAICQAGYMSQHESDLLSVLLPTTRVGIPQNNIPQFRKKLANRTFSQAQQDRKRKGT